MKKIIGLWLLFNVVSFGAGSFNIGHKNFSFHMSQDNRYTVVGGSVSYLVMDGLSTGLSFTTWLGDTPNINQITVPLTYYIPLDIGFRPYMGTFFSHTFVGDEKYEDYSSYGGRVGVALQTGSNSYISFGWVERFDSRGDTLLKSGHPEFSGGVSF